MNALADNNAAVIVCTDKMMPNAMLLNLDSNSVQGERYRDQINATEPLKKNLWKQTVEAKIRNQAALLDKLDKDGSQLKPYWQNVKSGDADNREGIAAKKAGNSVSEGVREGWVFYDAIFSVYQALSVERKYGGTCKESAVGLANRRASKHIGSN